LTLVRGLSGLAPARGRCALNDIHSSEVGAFENSPPTEMT
jgi:hypothetical protein